jgi:WD40 repeat protein
LDQASVQVVRILGAGRGAVVATIPHPFVVRGLARAPDGRRLATACADEEHRVFLWDYEANPGRDQPSLEPRGMPGIEKTLRGLRRWIGEPRLIDKPSLTPKGHHSPPTLVTLSHAGDLLATAGWDGTSRLWDAWTGSPLVESSGHLVGSIQFSADDRTLACSGEKDGCLTMYEIERGDDVRQRLHCDRVPGVGPCALAFSPSGGLLATVSHAHCVELWDLSTGRLLQAIYGLGSGLDLAFDPDPRSGEDRLMVSDPRDGWRYYPVRRTPAGPRLDRDAGSEQGPAGLNLACSADGRSVAYVAPGRARVGVLHRQAKQPVELPVPSEWSMISYLAMSPDGRRVAAGVRHGRGVRVWDARTGEVVLDLEGVPDARLEFSHDSRWLAAGTAQGYRFWDVQTREESTGLSRNVPDLPGPKAFSPDGRLVAFAPSNAQVHVAEFASRRELLRLEAVEQQMVNLFCFSPDGSKLAVSSEEHVVTVWDLRQLRQRLADFNLDSE